MRKRIPSPTPLRHCREANLLSVIYEDLRVKGLGHLLRSVALFRELGDIRKEIVATLNLGEGFSFSGLFPEERCEYAKVLRIGEKLGAFDELALASVFLAGFDEEEGKLAEALSHSLKALEYSEKTDANYIQNTVNVALARQYSLVGDLKKAETYFERMCELSPETSTPSLTWQAAITKGIYLTAKGPMGRSKSSFQRNERAGGASPQRARKQGC